jgi:hypothetical protein
MKIYTIFSNLCSDVHFNMIWHKRYAIISIYIIWHERNVVALMLEASRKWHHSHPVSHMRIMLVIYASSSCKSPWIIICFDIKMSEKCSSPSPSAMQLKNGCKTSNIEEKLYVISQLEKADRNLTYAVMLSTLILAYVQFVIMLRELQGVLRQELKCLSSKTSTFLSESMVPTTLDVSLLLFYCIWNK